MTGKTQGRKPEARTVVANDPEDRKGALKTIGGSQSDHWNNTLVNQAAQALWVKNSNEGEQTFEGRKENFNQANKLPRTGGAPPRHAWPH